jgi:hypothetical protein
VKYIYLPNMKKLALIATTFIMSAPAFAGEITSTITDSVQLNVTGAAVQSTRLGGAYSVSGTNIDATTFGGVDTGAGTYDVNTAGSTFSFSESLREADTAVTSQTVTTGAIASPNLYGDSVTSVGGSAGNLAGTLSNTTTPTVTAGGAGTTATGQRVIQLSVFQ